MFKKKMNIEINPSEEEIIYPDLADNLERKEKDRFAIVIKRLSNLEKMQALKIKDGHVQNDPAQLLRMSVKEIINAPLVNDDRELTIDDIFEAEELYGVFQKVYITSLNLNAPKYDKKKS
jgi:hypothetical protein